VRSGDAPPRMERGDLLDFRSQQPTLVTAGLGVVAAFAENMSRNWNAVSVLAAAMV